ncbi:MAG: 4-amino-4-deoxychorismate lyase [Paludibacter sp.]|nr:4-amino-4-deoxychorismate lyase [Paludibacter sp.]
MYRFIESIKLQDGKFKRIDLHQSRIRKAFEAFFPNEKVFDLAEFLSNSDFPTEKGIFKCRVIYNVEIRQLEFSQYVMRPINSLRLIGTEIESLPYKPEDRSLYNAAFALRGDCDDVLLVKNGLLTDTSYCNIALFDGNNWFTPQIPLLYGVNRAELLKEGKLIEKDIKILDLKNYQQIALFNAMIEFGELILDIDKVF